MGNKQKNYSLKKWRSWVSQTVTNPQCLTPWGLVTVMGLSGAIASLTVLSTPQAVQAYTARVSLFLNRNPGERYEAFLRRAEAIARAGVQRSFDADLLTTEVIVVVVGENQGVSIPIMEIQVTRNEWRGRPDPQYWARYYETAPLLLNFQDETESAQ